MTILISGDSWGLGEWHVDPTKKYCVAHPGLSEYLRYDNYPVINLSVPASSNWQVLDRLTQFFESGAAALLTDPIDKIFIFQTEWIREYRLRWHNPVKYTNPIVTYHIPRFTQDLRDTNLDLWYKGLSDLAVTHSVNVGLIGGCSDTKLVDYPNIQVACQSLTNLAINDCPEIENPVYCFRPEAEFVAEAKRTANADALDFLMQEIVQAESREQLWKSYPQWFWPDNNHANRQAHYKLYQFLKNQKWIY